MYLLVFVFLVVSVIGLHTQIYLLQVAKMFERQTAVGHAMVIWHKTAENVASLNAYVGSTAAGCSLTPGYVAGGSVAACPSLCYDSGTDPCQVRDPSTLTDSTRQGYDLPVGYEISDYDWPSVAYTAADGKRRVLTYAEPPSDMRLPIATPAIGVTIGELTQQLQRLKVSIISYGMVLTEGDDCQGVTVTGNDRLCMKSGTILPLPTGLVNMRAGSVILVTQR